MKISCAPSIMTMKFLWLGNIAVNLGIVIWDKREKVATLVKVSVPNDADLNRAEREKITKYQGLMYDIKRNCNLKISSISVIIGATKLVKKSFKSHGIYLVN